MPEGIKGLRAVAARDIIQQALAPNSGWIGVDHILSLKWLTSDLLVASLTDESISTLNEDGRYADANATVVVPVVELLIHIENGAGRRSEQLNVPRAMSNPRTRAPRLAIPQLSERDTERILSAPKCEKGTFSGPVADCLSPGAFGQPIKIDLNRYCQTLTAGDIEQFCKFRPGTNAWRRVHHRGRVLLVREYPADALASPPSETISDWFLIDNDQTGYQK